MRAFRQDGCRYGWRREGNLIVRPGRRLHVVAECDRCSKCGATRQETVFRSRAGSQPTRRSRWTDTAPRSGPPSGATVPARSPTLESDTQAATYFIIRDRWIPFLRAMPAPKAAELTKTETGADRSASAVETARELKCRSRWQARALIIEAKFKRSRSESWCSRTSPWPTPSRRGRASPSTRSCPRTCGWPVRRPRLIGPLFEKENDTRVAGAAFKKSTPARATPGDVAQRAWIARSCPAR